jgi:hypothetical protein
MERTFPPKYSAIFSGEISPRGNKKYAVAISTAKTGAARTAKYCQLLK